VRYRLEGTGLATPLPPTPTLRPVGRDEVKLRRIRAGSAPTSKDQGLGSTELGLTESRSRPGRGGVGSARLDRCSQDCPGMPGPKKLPRRAGCYQVEAGTPNPASTRSAQAASQRPSATP